MENRYDRRAFLKLSAGAAAFIVGGPLLAACGGDEPASTPSPTGAGGGVQAPKPESLNLLYTTVENCVECVKAQLSAFEEEFGFPLNIDSFPYTPLKQKVFAEFASNSDFYDIVIIDAPWGPTLVNKLEPLGSYITDAKYSSWQSRLDLGDFVDKIFYDTAVLNPGQVSLHFPNPEVIDLDAIKQQGFEIYGFPTTANALTMQYRKDLFEDEAEKSAFVERFGRELTVPETWEDFVPVAQFFTRPSERLWGTTLMAGAGDWATDDFKTLLAAFGGDGHLINNEYEVTFEGPEGIEALTYYQDLIQRHKVTPPGTTSASWDTVGTTWGNGLTAMGMNYHEMPLNENVNGEAGHILVPKQMTYGPHFGASMLSLNRFGKNKEWAYQALVWLTSGETQKREVPSSASEKGDPAKALHPTRKSVFESLSWDEFYPVLGESLALGVGRPRLSNYEDIDHEIYVAVNRAANGADPESELRKAAEATRRLLGEAGYVSLGALA